MNGRTLPSFTSTGVGGGTGLITPAAIGSNTPGPGVCWTYGTTSSNPSPMRSASIPAAAAAPTALPLSLALPAGTAAMNASYALWTDAACAGTRVTRTSGRPARRRRRSTRPRAPRRRSRTARSLPRSRRRRRTWRRAPSPPGPCCSPAGESSSASHRRRSPPRRSRSSGPRRCRPSPTTRSSIRARGLPRARVPRPDRFVVSSLQLPPGLTGSSRGARRPLVSRRGCPRAPRAESWKPQLFERARPSSARDRIPSLR